MSGDGDIPFEDNSFRHVIAKDVYEHLPEEVLERTLRESARVSERLFAIVPLGDGEKFIIPAYENDVTHIQKQPRRWWDQKFEDAGWQVERFSHLVPGMKQNYAQFQKGNSFYFLSRASNSPREHLFDS